MVPANDWDGSERRGLPIHIINYIDEKLSASIDGMDKHMKDHTKEEMDRYQEMIDKQDQFENKLGHLENSVQEVNDIVESNSKAIKQLTDSVNSWMQSNGEFITAMKRAFPKDEDGQPDYDGHRTAHLSWINDSKEAKEFKNYVKKVVAGAAAIAVVSWLWAVVWPAFLSGPK